MKTKSLILLVTLFLLAVPLADFAAPAEKPAPTHTAKPSKPITLSFNWEIAYGRDANWPFRPGGSFERLVTKHSEGLIKLDIKEALYGLNDAIFAVGDGRSNMTNQTVAPISGTYPLFDFGAIPGLFPADRNSTYEWVEAFLDPRMMEIWDKYGKPVGLKVIGADMTMSQNMQWSNKRVTKAADFKGLKTRTSGRTQTSTLVALGASPVTLPMAEVEEALRRGTVDAITTAISYGCERGLTALVKYASEWPIHPVFPYVIVVNAKVFDGLDPFFQQALLKAGTEQTYRSAAKGEQMAISYMMWARSVIEVLKPDPGEVDKAMPLMGAVVEEWLKYAGPFGKDVLRISLDYATGPGTKTVRAAISK